MDNIKLQWLDVMWSDMQHHPIWQLSKLHLAAMCGDEHGLSLACDDGISIDSQDRWGRTGVFIASQYGRSNAVKWLLDRGADPNLNCCLHSGRVPLHIASKSGLVDVARLLLCGKASVDARNSNEWTPLLNAANKDDTSMVQLLMKHGANKEATNIRGYSGLHLAASRGCIEMIELFLDQSPCLRDAKTTDGWTALDIACRKDHRDTARILRGRGAFESVVRCARSPGVDEISFGDFGSHRIPSQPYRFYRTRYITLTSIGLSWKTCGSDHVRKCILRVSNALVAEVVATSDSQSEWSYTLSDLQLSSKYKICVAAENMIGVSPEAAIEAFTSDAPESKVGVLLLVNPGQRQCLIQNHMEASHIRGSSYESVERAIEWSQSWKEELESLMEVSQLSPNDLTIIDGNRRTLNVNDVFTEHLEADRFPLVCAWNSARQSRERDRVDLNAHTQDYYELHRFFHEGGCSLDSNCIIDAFLSKEQVLHRLSRFFQVGYETCIVATICHGASDTGNWILHAGTQVSFEDVENQWRACLVCGQRKLLLLLDSCYSGHWVEHASSREYSDIAVQSSVAPKRKARDAFDATFTHDFVAFQKDEHHAIQLLRWQKPSAYTPTDFALPLVHEKPLALIDFRDVKRRRGNDSCQPPR